MTHALFFKIICSHLKSRETVPLSNPMFQMKEFVLKVGERQYVLTMNQNLTKQVILCTVYSLKGCLLRKGSASGFCETASVLCVKCKFFQSGERGLKTSGKNL